MLFNCPTCHGDPYVKVSIEEGKGHIYLACPDCNFKHDFSFPVTPDISRRDLFLAVVVMLLNDPSPQSSKKSIAKVLPLESSFCGMFKPIPWPWN